MAIYNVNKDTGDITETAGRYGSSEEYTEISYENWLALTPAQQENGKWDVTGVPGADGTISFDLMTKLWENPSPTSAFAAQDITGLTTLKDYDLFLIKCRQTTTTNRSVCAISDITGTNVTLSIPSNVASRGIESFRRIFTFDTTNNKITVSDCVYGFTGQSGQSTPTNLIPLAIYGIKTTASVKINAIAMDVSTSADKCMLSDGVTSVEDALESSGFDSAIAITSNNLPYTLTKSGMLRVAIPGSKAAGSYLNVSINGQVMMQIMKYNSSDVGCTYTLPLKKGDIITGITNSSDGTVTVFPYK